jgi:hypothetical protein
MRKKVIAVTAMLVLALTAYAYAQAQENTYKVSASTSPTKAGKKSKPVPVSVKFGYDVGEASGNRPIPVKKYSIRFAGMRVNTSVPGKCSESVLESQGADGCPANSIVGNGFIENQTGATANPADKSIECNAKLTVVNLGGNGKASIYVEGSPEATDPKEKCAIQLAAPIPAKFTNKSTMSSLDFDVPSSLLHPGAATISNAVVHVDSTIKKITKGGKGFFESVGGCKGGKRAIEVVFTPETGATKSAKSTAKCSS